MKSRRLEERCEKAGTRGSPAPGFFIGELDQILRQ
jgi:hypothetical protein